MRRTPFWPTLYVSQRLQTSTNIRQTLGFYFRLLNYRQESSTRPSKLYFHRREERLTSERESRERGKWSDYPAIFAEPSIEREGTWTSPRPCRSNRPINKTEIRLNPISGSRDIGDLPISATSGFVIVQSAWPARIQSISPDPESWNPFPGRRDAPPSSSSSGTLQIFM